ncbi:MAG: glycosyltransferase family 4 protein [Bacillota bacterium]
MLRVERKSLKVLLATHGALSQVSSGSRFIANLQQGLQELGHRADVLSFQWRKGQLVLTLDGLEADPAPLADAVSDHVSAALAHTLPDVPPVVRRREVRRYAFELAASLLPLECYDILHAQDVVAARALARIGRRRVPVVARFGGWTAEEVRRFGDRSAWRYASFEERMAALSVQRVLVPSHWLRSVFTQHYGLPEEAVTVVYPGLMPADEPPPAPVPRAPGACVILCPARLSPEKGHRHLLQALAILARRMRFTCLLAGSGPLHEPLRRMAARLRLGRRVTFLGDSHDIASLVAAADVVVLPSLLEALPHAVMEAQSAGKAVLATNAGGIPEMVLHGETGFLVPPGDPAALAAGLEQLLTDAYLRRRLGDRAAVWAQNRWDGRRTAREVAEVYAEVLHGYSRGGGVG